MTTPDTLIGICGRKRHGKDTAGRILQEELGFQLTAFADAVKRVAMDVYGLSWDQCYGDGPEKEAIDPRWGLSPRVIMQRIGTEIGRNIHQDTWVRHTLDNIKDAQEGRPYVVRDDARRAFRRMEDTVLASWFGRIACVLYGWLALMGFRAKPAHRAGWIITDVRFPNEAEAIRAAGGIVFKVVRPSLGVSDDEHPSETSVDLIEADHTIINDGTLADLRTKLLSVRMGLR